MANLGIMDLPYLLKARNGNLNDVQLFGVLVGEVEQPSHLEGLAFKDRNDRYAMVELVGLISKTGTYYTKGRALVVVNKNVIELAKSKASGRKAIMLHGGPIKLVDNSNVSNFVQMMKWTKGQYNSWLVTSLNTGDFTSKSHPEFHAVISNAFNNNWNYSYPVGIAPTYTDACEGFDFQPVGSNAITPNGWGLGKEEVSSEIAIIEDKPFIPNVQKVNPSSLTGLTGMNLGTSTSSNIADLVTNRTLTHNVVKGKKKFLVENRDKLAERTENAKKVEESVELADEKVFKIVQDLREFATDDSFDSAIRFTADRIKDSWGNKTGYITGRSLFKEALERVLVDYSAKGLNGESIISDNLNILGESLVDLWVENTSDDKENKLISEIEENRVAIYLRIIELFLGIRDKLSSTFLIAENERVDMLAIMYTNPYNLCFIDPRINIDELDKLAMMYGVDTSSPEIVKSRNVAYMHNYMLDSYNKIIAENTVVKYDDLLSNVKAGIILSKLNYDTLMGEGVIVRKDRIKSLQYYIHEDIDEKNFVLPKTGWRKASTKYVLQQNVSASELIQDFLDSGLGVKMTLDKVDYVSDFIFVKKELYIYNRLREIIENFKTPEISDEDIAKCIDIFENKKALELGLPKGSFKLEQRQAEAVALMRNPVMCLTGPAGSGKTTTAEALVFGAETLLDVHSEGILFCAPTGKAATRLREVVKRKTRTINSLFGIGGESMSLKEPEEVKKRDEIALLVIDEMSMPTLNLLYDMISRIGDNTRIFFLGDIEQLPPIGFGKPYATMLSFLPTIVLNVTKRAAEGSMITKNAKAIIYDSDGVMQDLENGDEFRILNTKDEQTVVNMISNIVDYHIGRNGATNFTPITTLGTDVNPDDIQVMTPVNGKIWGTQALNIMLQNKINPKRNGDHTVTYSKGPNERIEFRLNDRVIHTKKNLKDRTRLLRVGKGSFVPHEDNGIMNGDVGKIEGFYNWQDIDFDQVESEAKRDELKQEFKGNPNVMFIAVKYKDLDEATGEPIDFLILYRAEILNQSFNDFTVLSFDLNYLDLAYALTIHKMQGSQAKLVVMAMLPVGYGDFLSRNMLYAGITRGEKGDYLIGDVQGANSCVNKARRIETTSKRLANIDNF